MFSKHITLFLVTLTLMWSCQPEMQQEILEQDQAVITTTDAEVLTRTEYESYFKKSNALAKSDCDPIEDFTVTSTHPEIQMTWSGLSGVAFYLVVIEVPSTGVKHYLWTTKSELSINFPAAKDEAVLSFTFVSFCGDGGTYGIVKKAATINTVQNPFGALQFIGEEAFESGIDFAGTTIGGLSSIDYANGKYYMISDDANAPIRFYEGNLDFDNNSFSSVEVTATATIQDEGNQAFLAGTVDPEGLRVLGDRLIWISEGNINNGVSPSFREMTSTGEYVQTFSIPTQFEVTAEEGRGPRQNGTFEGLSLDASEEGVWVAMELPLRQDGPAPSLNPANSPVRISHFAGTDMALQSQFVYLLDPVAEPPQAPSTFSVNGLVEILALTDETFLFLERSFSGGYSDGGNTVKLFYVDASNATDVGQIDALQGADYTAASKTLIYNFDNLRGILTDGIVDNLEGLTFGPDLPNGNRSLVFVADDNFSAFGRQINQFIVFEVEAAN